MRVNASIGRDGTPPSNPAGTKRRRRLTRMSRVAVALGLLLAAVAAGCGSDDSETGGTTTAASGSDSGQQVTFGFSHPYAEVPIVQVVKDDVAKIAEAEGWEVLLDETQAGDVQDQTATLDTWITQKVTAINAVPTDPSALEALAKRAIDAGIIWTTYSVKMDNAAGGVLFSPELSGEVTAKATVDWINKNNPEAEVLILNSATSVSTKARTELPEKAIKAETKAKIVSVQDAVDQTKALQVTTDVLQANPNLSVVVGTNDAAALGAAEAFRKAGKDPKDVFIIGQDGSEEALVALKDEASFFKATAALDIKELCEETVGVTKRAIDRNWKPGDEQEWVDLAPTLVSSDDPALVDQFLAAYQ